MTALRSSCVLLISRFSPKWFLILRILYMHVHARAGVFCCDSVWHHGVASDTGCAPVVAVPSQSGRSNRGNRNNDAPWRALLLVLTIAAKARKLSNGFAPFWKFR